MKSEWIKVPCKRCGVVRTYKYKSKIRHYCKKCTAEMLKENGDDKREFDSEVLRGIVYEVKDRRLTINDGAFSIRLSNMPGWIRELWDIYDTYVDVRT